MSTDAPRLYLATPPLADARDFLPTLTGALAAGDIASLLIRFAGDDPRKNETILRALAPAAQEKGVAVLAEDAVTVALRGGADGAHINGSGDALADAVKKLSPKYIVGAGDLPTRDDAMRAGELNADYVLFDDDDLETLTERVGWWAQLFHTPCVARASSLDRVTPLVQAGADFILLDDAVWRDPRGSAAAIGDALKSLQPGDREYD